MYIVLELQTNADGTVGTIVSSYADKNEAESKFHQVLTYAAISTLPVHACVLLTSEGICVRSEYYSHVEPSPEPEPEETEDIS